jgi:hypothetical protein
MDAFAFIQKWRDVDLSERSAAQQHFLDLCELLDHPKPAELDKTGESFTFERGATKPDGTDGWADVWKRGFFGWEYKGKGKDLAVAFKQLSDYREDLENPPLLVVCDMERIVIRTNFTATPTQKYEIRLHELTQADKREILHAVFFEPDKLRPDRTREAITADAAGRIADIAQDMRGRGLDARKVAHFLDRIVFCLFAEDIGLLPEGLFSRIVENSRDDPDRFSGHLRGLFDAMAGGGTFGADLIRHFNGNLFMEGDVLQLTADEIEKVYHASRLEWDGVDPSIFGTLFERGLDPDKRSQIGAHYTSRDDIVTIVEPVVMWPLRREWEETRETVVNLLTTGKKRPKGHVAQPPSAGEPTGEGACATQPPQSGATVPHELQAAIAAAAKELNELRENWLNPPEWTTTEVLEFPGSVDGPWARYIVDVAQSNVAQPPAAGEPTGEGARATQPRAAVPHIGTVRYPRPVPQDEICAKKLKKRTLTNLYNERPTWLGDLHRNLDEAVFVAYAHVTGDAAWRPGMDDEEVLEKLLALNLHRPGGEV